MMNIFIEIGLLVVGFVLSILLPDFILTTLLVYITFGLLVWFTIMKFKINRILLEILQPLVITCRTTSIINSVFDYESLKVILSNAYSGPISPKSAMTRSLSVVNAMKILDEQRTKLD